MIGERLKHAFGGNNAWILSYREECFEQIGLKPSIKIPLYNGSLECEFRKYAMFEGKMKEFREEGGIVKTEEEKQAMAEKHRFKKNRDFKQRMTDEEQNEEGDIRSFKFHSFEKNYLGEERREPRRFEHRDDDRRFERREGRFERKDGRFERRDGHFERRDGRFERKDGRRFERRDDDRRGRNDGKTYGKGFRNKRFDHDDD
jgi:putative N6-adenine-specific DNA methylase